MSEHDDAGDGVTGSPVPGEESGLLGGTALGALPGAQPPQDGAVARALDPGESPLLAPLLGSDSSAGYFSIDLDRAPQAIADLNAAAEYLLDRAYEAGRLTLLPAPGADGVSLYAADTVARWATSQGADNLEAVLRAGAEQLRSFAAKLATDVQTHLGVDELKLPMANPGLAP